MARDFATVNLALWGDDDFLDLTVDEQLLFLTLWTSPSLSYCGSGDWHPGRIAAMAKGWTRQRVEHAAAGLSRALFLLVDADTDEYLLRSWIKHDGLWRSPVMVVSMANARAELASRSLRGVVVHEVLKLHNANPELKHWSKPAVASMLDQNAVDPADLEPFSPTSDPSSIPSPNPPANPCPNPPAKGQATPSLNPSPNPPSTPTPTPHLTPSPLGELELFDDSTLVADATPKAEKSKRGTRLPEDWVPSRTAGNQKAEAGHSNEFLSDQLERFRNHWIAKSGADAVKLDWDRTWQNWLKKAGDFAQREQRNTYNRPKTGATTTDVDWQRWSARLGGGEQQTQKEIA